jgi:uncharacterized membrane protein
MTALTSLFSSISTFFSSVGSKLVTLVIIMVILVAVAAGVYFYVRHKDQVIAGEQTDVTQLQGQLASAIAANNTNLQLIVALQAQQQQAAVARTAMTGRDQTTENNAASIQNVINHDSLVCPPPATHSAANQTVAPGKDNVVAPVLKDALQALASAQSASGVQK